MVGRLVDRSVLISKLPNFHAPIGALVHNNKHLATEMPALNIPIVSTLECFEAIWMYALPRHSVSHLLNYAKICRLFKPFQVATSLPPSPAPLHLM